MESNYDRELLRMQILESMQSKAAYGHMLHNIRDHVIPKYPIEKRGEKLRDRIFEEVFSLLSDGLIQPYLHISQGSVVPKWESFQLTTYGKYIIEKKAEHPYFEREYLKRLSSMVPESMELDEVVMFYAKESVQLFRQDFHTSSVVMLGVASEQVVELIGRAILNTLSDKTKGDFRKVLEHRNVKDKIDRVFELFQSTCDDSAIKDFFDHTFRGFVTLLRKSRNDYGHPSGTSATRDEALEYLNTFPQYIRRMYQVIQYYSQKLDSIQQ